MTRRIAIRAAWALFLTLLALVVIGSLPISHLGLIERILIIGAVFWSALWIWRRWA